jgi:glutamate-5-semialdehyde dehydrogenase
MSIDETAATQQRGTAERPVAELMREIGQAARAAALPLSLAPGELKNRALLAAAAALRAHRHRILAANQNDLREAAGATGAALSGPLLDRLRLDDKRVLAMADGLEEIARLADPIGTVLAEWTRPNGLHSASPRAARRRRAHLRESPQCDCGCRAACA